MSHHRVATNMIHLKSSTSLNSKKRLSHSLLAALAALTIAFSLTACSGGRKMVPGEVVVVVEDNRQRAVEGVSGHFSAQYANTGGGIYVSEVVSGSFRKSFRIKLTSPAYRPPGLADGEVSDGIPLISLSVRSNRDDTPINLNFSYTQAKAMAEAMGRTIPSTAFVLKVLLTRTGPVEAIRLADQASLNRLERDSRYQALPADDGILALQPEVQP